MMEQLYRLNELQAALDESDAVVIYFSNDACNVCKTLKPKIRELLEQEFPRVRMIYIDTEKSPAIAGQFRVFTIPTIDIYFTGKEHARFSRNLMIPEFEKTLRRPYDMLFTNA